MESTSLLDAEFSYWPLKVLGAATGTGHYSSNLAGEVLALSKKG